jgi:hypothetical protein
VSDPTRGRLGSLVQIDLSGRHGEDGIHEKLWMHCEFRSRSRSGLESSSDIISTEFDENARKVHSRVVTPTSLSLDSSSCLDLDLLDERRRSTFFRNGFIAPFKRTGDSVALEVAGSLGLEIQSATTLGLRKSFLKRHREDSPLRRKSWP